VNRLARDVPDQIHLEAWNAQLEWAQANQPFGRHARSCAWTAFSASLFVRRGSFGGYTPASPRNIT